MLWCLVGRERICVVLWLTQVCIDEGAVADRVRWWHGATGGGVITRRGYWLPLVVADLLAMDGIKDEGCWTRSRSGWMRHRRVDLEVAMWKHTVLTSTDPHMNATGKDDRIFFFLLCIFLHNNQTKTTTQQFFHILF
ncbi:unnamed protein product [Vicia faba]|uniref:Secreted protein n=1 Tax=Vicia faba TaxID=3906 RepID=A0AAV0ZLZ5_VICFA|nr:unnamed protein product [Vicia faba]